MTQTQSDKPEQVFGGTSAWAEHPADELRRSIADMRTAVMAEQKALKELTDKASKTEARISKLERTIKRYEDAAEWIGKGRTP